MILFGEGWHTDSTYTKEPPRFTMLYSIKSPPKGKGNTLISEIEFHLAPSSSIEFKA